MTINQSVTFESLKGQVCVVTGGAGVIGQAMLRALAAAGVKTVVADLNEEAAKTTATQLEADFGVKSIGLAVNVLDKDSLVAAKEIIHKELGKIDLLINGAGGNSPKATTALEQIPAGGISDMGKTLFGLEVEGFDKVFDLNFKGTLLPTMVFATDMVEAGRGSILNISSMNAFRPLTKIPAYSAAKASINNFTQWLAVHFAQTGVRVNAIAPGFFLTSQNRFLLTDEKTGEPTPRGLKITANTPMGRYGEVEELCGAVLFLLSQAASFITGVVLPVDGGFSAYSGV